MKEALITLAAMLLVIGAVTWITPAWLMSIMEWILCAAVILWFFPSVIFV